MKLYYLAVFSAALAYSGSMTAYGDEITSASEVKAQVARHTLYGGVNLSQYQWRNVKEQRPDNLDDNSSLNRKGEVTPNRSSHLWSMQTKSTGSLATGQNFTQQQVVSAEQSAYKWGVRSTADQNAYKWGVRSTADQNAYKWGVRSTADQNAYKWGVRSTADQEAYKWGIRSTADQDAYKWGVRSTADQEAYKWGIRSTADQDAYKWGVR